MLCHEYGHCTRKIHGAVVGTEATLGKFTREIHDEKESLVIVKFINSHNRSRPKFHLYGISSDQVELLAIEGATTLFIIPRKGSGL